MSEPARNTQSKRWMITLNNPTFKESELIYELCNHEQRKYACWCAENEDEENHTPHYHIYISFTRMWRFMRLKNILPRADIEMAKKPELACFRYCTKGNKDKSIEPFYMEFGRRNPRTGEKSEKQKQVDASREETLRMIRTKKMKFEDLSDDQLLDNKLATACERALRGTVGPMRKDIKICCFVSPTGWGKSYSIWDTFKDVATVEFGSSQEWFINPEKEIMLFDEFCGQIRCQKFLKYLDTYPIALPVKGGHRPCYWKAIFICSNTSPDDWYTKIDEKTGLRESTIPQEVRDALYRRLGYANFLNPKRETHVYDTLLYTLQQARDEMVTICKRIYDELYVEHEELPDDQNTQPPAEQAAAAAAAVDADSLQVEPPNGDLASYMLDDISQTQEI